MKGFVKSESDELKIFDIASYNYKNGIYLSDRSKNYRRMDWMTVELHICRL